jgi:hypothetical protein
LLPIDFYETPIFLGYLSLSVTNLSLVLLMPMAEEFKLITAKAQ